MQGSSNCRPLPTAQSDSSPSSSYSSSSSGTSLPSLTSSSSPSFGPLVFSCHSSSSLYSSSSASSIFSASFMSSSSSFSPFLLILYVFILLVHTLFYSSSCTYSLTFLSPLLHHLHPSPALLPFPPSLSFFFSLLYSLLFPSSFDLELPLVLTLSSSSP